MILWWDTCSFKKFDPLNEPELFVAVHIQNILGLSLLVNNNLFFSSAMIVVLQIPIMVPVFKREIMNRMYTPTVYFLARLLSNLILQIFYPILMVTLFFFAVGTPITWQNTLYVYAVCIMLNIMAVTFAYFCGVFKDDENSARMVINFFAAIWMLGTGIFSNINASGFVKFLSWTSPMRYGVEVLFRRFSNDIPNKDLRKMLFDSFGYSYGLQVCFGVLFCFILLFVAGGLIVINVRNRKYL